MVRGFCVSGGRRRRNAWKGGLRPVVRRLARVLRVPGLPPGPDFHAILCTSIHVYGDLSLQGEDPCFEITRTVPCDGEGL